MKGCIHILKSWKLPWTTLSWSWIVGRLATMSWKNSTSPWISLWLSWITTVRWVAVGRYTAGFLLVLTFIMWGFWHTICRRSSYVVIITPQYTLKLLIRILGCYAIVLAWLWCTSREAGCRGEINLFCLIAAVPSERKSGRRKPSSPESDSDAEPAESDVTGTEHGEQGAVSWRTETVHVRK